MISEWDPILTPSMKVYADLRLNEQWLEIKLAESSNYTIKLDAKVIPQLIKILQRMEVKV
jgi:hypothetical protein